MNTFTRSNIDAMPSRFRAHFINSLSGFKSANLIGTADASGATNLAMLSSVVHLGAQPPLLAHITRPQSVERHSLENLRETGVYTLNHVHEEFHLAAHQTAAKYPREISEFSAVGLTSAYIDGFLAPYVAESKLNIGLKLVEIVPIKHNHTEMVIGEIVWVRCPENIIHGDGHIAIEALSTVSISGLDHYHRNQSIQRLSYPSTSKSPTRLDFTIDVTDKC